MPFGMKNSASTFQRLMNSVISGMENVQAYLDDLVVYTSTWEEHLSALRELFHRLRAANLTLNLIKSEFVHAKVKYLGHLVGGGEVAPLDSKVAAINKFPVPTSRKEVQRFIGMLGFYRRFCSNFSQVASSLTDLMSNKRIFSWTDSCQRAFLKLKRLLLSAPVLKAPDFSLPFILQVDACDVGVGAVMLQEVNGILHPICYFSSKLKPHQRPYSTIEKEALALITALEHFEVYVGNASQKIVVYTDHNPLQFVTRMKTKNHRLTRWALTLQSYNLEIRHIKGKDNLIADALSRAH